MQGYSEVNVIYTHTQKKTFSERFKRFELFAEISHSFQDEYCLWQINVKLQAVFISNEQPLNDYIFVVDFRFDATWSDRERGSDPSQSGQA